LLEPGRPAQRDSKEHVIRPAQIGVSLQEFFDGVQSGAPIWLDDGKIGGIIREVTPDRVSVEITQARPGGEKLGAEKGINVPESQLCLSSLTADHQPLGFLVNSGTTPEFAKLRSVKLAGDELLVPGQQRIRLRDSRQFFQGFPSEAVGDLSQRGFFGIG
jgi:hypothetical protein